jgi:formylglycine-generating enzyme required for sulfatase activity
MPNRAGLLLVLLVACRRDPPPAPEPAKPPNAVRIEGGSFAMGWNDPESLAMPITRVTLSAFSIDRTEVTVAAYAACVKAGKCTAAETGPLCNASVAGRDQHPINCVNWLQAKAYCEAQGQRLPTESEWEFAARGAAGHAYPWGDEPPNAARARWNAKDGTEPVGSHPSGATANGVQDLAGNVFEWVEDGWYDYPGSSVTNPRHPTGEGRIFRGGGWYDTSANALRSNFRSRSVETFRGYGLGFRCATGT